MLDLSQHLFPCLRVVEWPRVHHIEGLLLKPGGKSSPGLVLDSLKGRRDQPQAWISSLVTGFGVLAVHQLLLGELVSQPVEYGPAVRYPLVLSSGWVALCVLLTIGAGMGHRLVDILEIQEGGCAGMPPEATVWIVLPQEEPSMMMLFAASPGA